MTSIIRFALPAMLALGAQFPHAALAQPGAQAAPMDPSAPAAPLTYDSAFAGYRPAADVAVVDWKESNARVAQPLPGADEHAGHDMGAMKHGAAPDVKAPPPAKKDPHHGHEHKE